MMKTKIISDKALLRRLRRIESARRLGILESHKFASRHSLPVLKVESDGDYHYLVDSQGRRVTGKLSWSDVQHFVSTHLNRVVEGFDYEEAFEGKEVEAQKSLAEKTKAFFGHC